MIQCYKYVRGPHKTHSGSHTENSWPVKMAAFWDIVKCSFVEAIRRFRGACFPPSSPWWWSSKHLWNIRQLLRDFTVQHPEKALSFILSAVKTSNIFALLFHSGLYSYFGARAEYSVNWCLTDMRRATSRPVHIFMACWFQRLFNSCNFLCRSP